MFRSLKISQKLAMLAFVMAVPVVVLIYLFVESRNEQIVFTNQELLGLEYVAPLKDILELIPQHRAAANAALSGDAAARPKLTAIEQKLDGGISAMDALDGRLGERLGTAQSWKSLKAKWGDLKDKSPSLSSKDSFELHTRLISDLLEFYQLIGDRTGLTTDPQLDSYYLASSLLTSLTAAVENVSQLQGFGAGLLARQKVEPQEAAQVLYLARQAGSATEAATRSLASAVRYNGAIESKITGPLSAAAGAAAKLAQIANRDLGVSGALKTDSKAYHDASAAALESYSKLEEVTAASLGDLLRDRVARLSREKYTQLGAAGTVLVLALLAIYWVSLTITSQIRSITNLFSQIGVGNYSVRAKVASNDEFGVMAKSLNSMLDNTLKLIQSREERDQIQGSIRKLLEEVSGVAEGDLSKEAEVTADMTGAIADSFNYMIAELRQIISQVQQTTHQVTNSASDVQRTAERLAAGSEEQAQEIRSASSSIDQMAQSIQQVSATAGTAAGVAGQALEAARQGSETVTKTIQGMNSIRGQVQETAKRIKRLGESSQEIGEIVQLIRDIADRTSILALNASIQAAQAGDAGRGFAVVAEEVERLAERAAESTKRIATLIQSVQSDTGEAIAAMEETTREVVGGSQLANEAGQKLVQIEQVSRQISELVGSIAQAADNHAQGSVAVSHKVTGISQVTQETAEGARQAAASIRNLAQLADELNESVSRFKLPEHEGTRVAA